MAAHYSIGAVSKLTGLSIDTLRAWERRYGVVTPVRDDRGRMYTDEHIRRLQRLAKLVESGHSIGRIAALSDRALAKLLDGSEPASTTPPTGVDLAPLLDAMTRYDLPTVDALLVRHALLLSPSQFVFSVVIPAMRTVGDRWAAGDIRPTHEHLLSAVVRSVLGSLLRTLPARPDARTLICATPSGDRHELGLLCAAVLAAAAGLKVIYLGPDLPADDILDIVSASRPAVLLLSATIGSAIKRGDVAALARAGKHTEIWVGGPHAAAVRDAVARPVRIIERLEDLTELFERYEH